MRKDPLALETHGLGERETDIDGMLGVSLSLFSLSQTAFALSLPFGSSLWLGFLFFRTFLGWFVWLGAFVAFKFMGLAFQKKIMGL